MATELDFLAEILEEPTEPAHKAALSDWLDEHDQPFMAARTRLLNLVVRLAAGQAYHPSPKYGGNLRKINHTLFTLRGLDAVQLWMISMLWLPVWNWASSGDKRVVDYIDAAEKHAALGVAQVLWLYYDKVRTPAIGALVKADKTPYTDEELDARRPCVITVGERLRVISPGHKLTGIGF